MAQVVQRTWRSGPRKVKRSAWGYTLQVGGKQERKYDAAWSKEDAQNALAARLLDRDTAPPAPAAAVVAFKAMTERYLAEKKAGSKKTIENDRQAIAKFLEFFGAETPIDTVTAPRIAEYRLRRLETPVAGSKRRTTSAVNRELSILVGLLRMAAGDECGYLSKVPTVRRLKEPQGRLRFLELVRIEDPSGAVRWQSDEAARLLAECRAAAEHAVSTCRSPYLHAIVVVALHTGMRKGEILGLEWSRVDFSRGVIQLEQTKNGTRREVPMDRAVYDALTDVRRLQGGKPGRVFPGTSARTAFFSACERAGITNFHFHDLRHTCASWLVMRGRPLKEVQELLGHASIRMTERYAHLAPERLRDAVAMLDEISTTSAHEAPQPMLEAVTVR